MIFKYGSFTHNVGDVNLLSHQKRRKYSERGGRYSQESTLHIRVDLSDDTRTLLLQEIAGVEANYLNDGKDAGLYYDDGTPTFHVLPSSNSVNGVQVVKLDYLKDDGAENNIQRTVDIILQAEYLQIEVGISQFQEMIHNVGNCGPRYEIEDTFFGPIAILTALSTAKRIIQTGFAEGVIGYPIFPGPYLPANEQQHLRQISLYGPDRGIQTAIGYGVRWQYHFVVPIPSVIVPATRP